MKIELTPAEISLILFGLTADRHNLGTFLHKRPRNAGAEEENAQILQQIEASDTLRQRILQSEQEAEKPTIVIREEDLDIHITLPRETRSIISTVRLTHTPTGFVAEATNKSTIEAKREALAELYQKLEQAAP